MTIQALFGISVLLSFVASGLVAGLYVWPWVRARERQHALLPLVLPHTFRFVGLSFLVPGSSRHRCRRPLLRLPPMAI